ncbi:MAG TPA: LptF/LptG family permease [Bacteroidales bacterium]|nr:LptF/LptG family permease [Bacteroidales bacterium]
MIKPALYILDWYIIRKFLGTFFFTIALIVSIAVVFDLSEKIDDFLENNAPLRKIIFDYYLNFIPYFAVLFSPLFTFITVIYFTSRMAYNTEIIAILSSGVSFHRLLVPYFISAFALTLFSFSLNNFVIPHANARKLIFEETYYHNSPKVVRDRNIHKQIEPGIFIYLESYNTISNSGRKFSMEKFEEGRLVSKLFADEIRWDSLISKWHLRNYYIRNYLGDNQALIRGQSADTVINLTPEEFRRRENAVEAMNLGELNRFIREQKLQGAPDIDRYLIDKHRRFSFPFSAFILTLIGVSVSSRKAKGGIGMQLGIGLLISFSYIVFMQFSSQFAISGSVSPFIAVWIPNVLFTIIAAFIYRLAPK